MGRRKPVCAPDDTRLLAARARLLVHQGDLAAGTRSYELARVYAQERAPYWLADTALDVQRWKEALHYAEQAAQSLLNDARAQLTLARIITLCAERQRLCKTLDCRTNIPGAEFLSEGSRLKFEKAISLASRLANTSEVGRWQARGQAVFAPSIPAARALAAIPAQPDDTAALVAVLGQLNNRTAAVQVARRFADHPSVLLQIALCSLNDPSSDGLAAAEKAALAASNQPLAHAAFAVVAQQANEPAVALEAYENALLIWADEPGWHDAAGDLSMKLGNVQQAVAHRKQALVLDPMNGRHAFKLGQACLSDDDISGAISYLEKSSVLEPSHASTWLALASSYSMADRLPQALEAAKKASELDQASAEGLLIAGETALSMGHSDQALDFAQDAVRREPENAGAILFLSNVLVQRGRAAEGLEILEGAAPAAKAVFSVAFERARLIHSLHGPRAALDGLERLVKDFPEEPGLLSFLAHTQAEIGDAKAAERYAFRALRLDPNQPDLTLMLGRLHRKNGQLDQAVHRLTEVIRMAPDELEAYLELASVYQERREFTQALQVYQQAIRIAPTDYQAYYQSGIILRDSKDYSGAEDRLRRAAELAPDNLTIRRQLVAVIALNLVHRKQEVAA